MYRNESKLKDVRVINYNNRVKDRVKGHFNGKNSFNKFANIDQVKRLCASWHFGKRMI